MSNGPPVPRTKATKKRVLLMEEQKQATLAERARAMPPIKKVCNDDAILAAIPGSAGIMTVVAQRTGVSRGTVSLHIRANPVLLEAYESEVESLGDLCETALVSRVRSGDIAAIIFSLKTRFKKRGYVEESIVDHRGNVTLAFGGRADAGRPVIDAGETKRLSEASEA